MTVAEAETDLKTIHDNLLSQYPGVNIGYGLRIFQLLGLIVSGYSITIWLLAAAVSVLLLASFKRCEPAVRSGIESSTGDDDPSYSGNVRWRVVRQLLFENMSLTSIGGLAGLIVAHLSVQGTKNFMPADLYRLQEFHVDSNALLFVFVLIFITSLIAGLLPAWSLSQVTLIPGLKDGDRTGTGGPHRHRIQSGLVTAR